MNQNNTIANAIVTTLGIKPNREDFDSIHEGTHQDGTEDFNCTIGGAEYRVIDEDYIDGIQQRELQDDEYTLGCFNAGFLSDILDIDYDVIEAMQQAEAFEAIGKLIISLGKVGELQEAYVRFDGYGHHFSHYDGSEEECSCTEGNFHVFRTN